MDKFVMKKSTEAIIEIVDKANEGLDKKEYSFNGFVVSACEFALKHMK